MDEQGLTTAAQVSDGECEKTLVMKYVNPQEESDYINGVRSWYKLNIVCIVFDVTLNVSFTDGLGIYESIQARNLSNAKAKESGLTGNLPSAKVPVVFVGAFGENADDEPNALNTADRFCLDNGLPTRSRVSIVDGYFGKPYDDLLGVAMYPQVACADYYDDVEGGERG